MTIQAIPTSVEQELRPLRDEFLVFGSPCVGDAEIAEVVHSLQSGWIGTGPKVSAFERMLEDYIGVSHVRCVSSCTSALTMAMVAVGIGPGDEVIVPSFTFVATANAVVHAGATPVLVDCEPETGLLDLDAAEAAITDATRAIIPVHMAGRPMDMDRLNGLRDRTGLLVIEDAAHALGAEWRGQRIGASGNVVAYSFYVTKNITTIEGGALATTDSAIASKIEQLALHGLSAGAWQRYSEQGFRHYEAGLPGYKANMTDVQASLGLRQLPRLDGWIDRRAQLWEQYDQMLEGLPVTRPAPVTPEMRHARHLYQIRIEPDAMTSRDEVLDRLTAQRIGCGVHYRAVHLHPYYRNRFALLPGALPISGDLSERTLSLPLSPKVTDADQYDVVHALATALDL